jgi:acetylornithine deacetylase
MNTTSLLRTLVGFDTTSRNSNLALITWAAEYLQTRGARVRLTHDDTGTKANLLASLGPDREGGIVLSGHSDVVPVDGQDWASDPFTLTERDGLLFGRGSADMKGFIAASLAAVPGWLEHPLQKPIHIALSYDEETGCLGISRLVADMLAHVAKPAVAVIGEPTEMRVADRHRGFYGYRTRFTGRPAHSSDPALGASAIGPAAEFVRFLLNVRPQTGNSVPRATVNVGRIEGGTAINIVPHRCDVTWEFRPEAVADADDLQREIRAYLSSGLGAGIGIATEEVALVPPFAAPDGAAAIGVAAALGAEMPAVPLLFGSEAGFFQQAGISTVVCGPGSIAQAHQANEWIAPAQLEKADRFMASVGQWAAG